jgi:hypothetical protein
VTGCTWCRSAAVKSKCYTLDDAKALPPSIFACDGISEKVVEEPKKIQVEEKATTILAVAETCSATTQSACDAVTGCTWCRSAAVKSKCYTLDDAKALPPSIFACDGISEDAIEEPKKTQVEEKSTDNATVAETCSATTQSACDAVTGCTWCRSAAVRSK